MKNRSFQLIRTNPRLTTNIKLVVASDYNLYLESFNSCSDLSKDKYKHYLLKTDSMYEYDFPKFYNGLSKTLAYTPYTFDDVSVMYDRYENQFDEMYYSGADEVEDKWYDEEYEYFAPLYIVKENLPSNFVIMRVDDPVIYTKKGSDYSIDSLRNDNFRQEILDKWKCVTIYDLSDNTNLGKFLKRNIDDNSRFPDYSLFFDIKLNNFTKYAGMKFEDGIYTTAEMYLNDKLEKQNTHYDLEDFITKGFERTGMVYPYILNLKFLYNDTPATPDKLLPYSMNRYYGFYTDSLELIRTITTYNLPTLRTDIFIKNNIFVDSKGVYINPYKNVSKDSDWLQYNEKMFEIRKQSNGAYKIISDIDLTNVSITDFNTGLCEIKDSKINILSNNFNDIDIWTTSDGEKELMFADLYLIEIDGVYHVLKNNYTKTVTSNDTVFTNNYYIHSDYNINSDNSVLEYYKGGKLITYNDPENIYNYDIKTINNITNILSEVNTINYYKRTNGIYITKDIFTNNSKPLVYNIYRVNFSDIKDFDYDRLNTSYSDYEYEKSEYTDTYEEKLYMGEYRDKNTPIKTKLNRFNEDGQYKKMVISSEYIADGDLYEIKDDVLTNKKTLNSMWNKTQTVNKWVYKDSIGHSDYPYKLNNSYDVGGIYNRSVNIDLTTSNITQKNLDYFYRIGEFYGKDDVKIIEKINNEWVITCDPRDYEISQDGVLTYTNVSQTDGKLDMQISNLEIDQEYFISYNLDLSLGEKISDNENIKIGFDSITFDSKTINYKLTEPVTISFIAKSLSNVLKFTIQNYTKVIISNFSVTKIINKYYYNQSTNIQTSLLNKYELNNSDNRFNLDYYINSDFDYFDYFFNNIMYYEDYGKLGIKPYSKYSVFNGGTNTLPAKTLFNGIEYELYNIKDMILGDNINGKEKINTIITNGGKDYNGYKMSVILSENYNYYKFNTTGMFTTDYQTWGDPYIQLNNNDQYIDYTLEKINISADDIYSIKWDLKEREFDLEISTDFNPNIPNSGTLTVTLRETT